MVSLASTTQVRFFNLPSRVPAPMELRNDAYENSRSIALNAPGIDLNTGLLDTTINHWRQLANASYAKPFDPNVSKADRIEMERFELLDQERKEATIIAANATTNAHHDKLKENEARAQAGEEPSPSLVVTLLAVGALTYLFSFSLHDAFYMVDASMRWPIALIAGAILSGVPVAIILHKWSLKTGWSWVGLLAGFLLVLGQFIFRYYFAQSTLSPALAPCIIELAILLYLEHEAWKLHKTYDQRAPHLIAAEAAFLDGSSNLRRASEYETKITGIDVQWTDFVQYMRNREIWAINLSAIVTAIAQAAELGFRAGHDEKLRRM
jgi:hypothetical protein